MSPQATSDFPPLASEQAVIEVVRHAVGSQVAAQTIEWHVRREHYVVASVGTNRPVLRLVVKLEMPGARPNRHLDAMAAIAGIVRAQTSVPTFEVIAVDVTKREWPWEYLIATHIAGVTWQALYPRLDAAARATAQRQIGRSAGELHAIRFGSFGHIGPDGAVVQGTTLLAALAQRAQRRIQTPRYLSLMQDVLESRAGAFEGLATATLCHEDMNPNNLVFEVRGGQPVLAGILDFESAWASTGESDLARLELWRFTAGAALRAGYSDSAVVADAYAGRKPVLQLRWCLEYAEFHASEPGHQAVTDGVCAELGIPPIRFRLT